MDLPEKVMHHNTGLLTLPSNMGSLTQSGFNRVLESGLIDDIIEAVNNVDESVLKLILVLPVRNRKETEENQETQLSIDQVQKVFTSKYPEIQDLAFKSLLYLTRYQHHTDWWNASEGILSESERNNIRVNSLDLKPIFADEKICESA